MNILLHLINKSKADDLGLLIAKGSLVISVMLGFSALTSTNCENGDVNEAIRCERQRSEEEENNNCRRRLKAKKLTDIGNGRSTRLAMRVTADGLVYTITDTVITNDYLSNEYVSK